MQSILYGEGDLRDRIRNAAPDLLSIEADVCPSSWRRDIRWIHRRLTSHQKGTLDGQPCFDYVAATRYRTAAKKIADRVQRLVYKCQDYDRVEDVEAENVEASLSDAGVSFKVRCPVCSTEVGTTLKPKTKPRCKCGLYWHVTISAIGVKKRPPHIDRK